MKKNLTEKIIGNHLLEGKLVPGTEVCVKIDQTLTQDATGTLAYLEFEGMGVDRIKTKRSVSYVDHNTLQGSYENADDHKFLQSIAAKYGILFSPNGTGVCHQLHLERFGIPGEILIGSDSHTPTGGGLGMLSIGVGGMDVAWALASGKFYMKMPEVINVELSGKLKNWASAKDIILELLRRYTVKGGVGKIFEYSGTGVETLSVYDRATIANMGAELGLTTSIFPSDNQTKKFLEAQGSSKEFKYISADKGARYDGTIKIDLTKIVPMIACPHSPDNVKTVKEVAGTDLDQVVIGSCTNSSLTDLMYVARILKNKKVKIPTIISPGSKQVLMNLIKNCALADMIESGVRILEPACGPCIGMGCAPNTAGVSLRTFNRNFKGRSGTDDAEIYIAGPIVAAFSALTGKITVPQGKMPAIKDSGKIAVMRDLIQIPKMEGKKTKIYRGKNIKPIQKFSPPEDIVSGKIVAKFKDNITTDDIIPAGAKILPLRSNIPAISEYVFTKIDPDFVRRVKENKGGIIIAGDNYGQGSSREHAALCPRHLGIKAVISKSFARIHKANLVNFGILPLSFVNSADYDTVKSDDVLEIIGVKSLLSGNKILKVKNISGNSVFEVTHDLADRQLKILLSGGLLNYR